MKSDKPTRMMKSCRPKIPSIAYNTKLLPPKRIPSSIPEENILEKLWTDQISRLNPVRTKPLTQKVNIEKRHKFEG